MTMVALEDEPLADEEEWPDGEDGSLDGIPASDMSGQLRRRLQRARDCLIDCEDELLYVLRVDESVQPLIDQVVALLMDVTGRAERGGPGSTQTAPRSASG